MAHPDKPVVSVTGDGGFMFAVQELATAAQYGIALVTLVFNNASFGNVLRDQRTAFGNRVIGSVLDNPDFMLLAKAFGVEGHRVTSPAALERVLAKAIACAQAGADRDRGAAGQRGLALGVHPPQGRRRIQPAVALGVRPAGSDTYCGSPASALDSRLARAGDVGQRARRWCRRKPSLSKAMRGVPDSAAEISRLPKP